MKYVYRIFAASGDLLYVGQTNNVKARLAQHARWLADFPQHKVRIDGPFSAVHATLLERRAILTENPQRNKHWRLFKPAETVVTATIAAPVAATYLTGSNEGQEAWAVQIVEGFGLVPVEVLPYMRTYRLIDVEAKYLELAEVAS